MSAMGKLGRGVASIVLEISASDPGQADAILASIAPDNVGLPEGLAMSCERRGSVVEVRVEGPLEKLLSIKSAVEDILVALTPVVIHASLEEARGTGSRAGSSGEGSARRE